MQSKSTFKPSKLYPLSLLALPVLAAILPSWAVHGTMLPPREEWRNDPSRIYWAIFGIVVAVLWYIRELPRCLSAIIFGRPVVSIGAGGISVNGQIVAPLPLLRRSSITTYHPYTIVDVLRISDDESTIRIDCTFLDTNSAKLKELIEDYYSLRGLD